MKSESQTGVANPGAAITCRPVKRFAGVGMLLDLACRSGPFAQCQGDALFSAGIKLASAAL